MLIAFQVGDDTLHLTEAFGRAVSLDGAGFDPAARMVTAPEPTSAAAPVPQCVLIVRRAP